MTIVVTKEKGATAAPVGMLYVEPARQVFDAGSTTALARTGVDAATIADLLSAFLAHERCGVLLYRSVAGRTRIPGLRSRYEHFLGETQGHVERLEGLIRVAGGDPHFVSPAARATEKANTVLLESTFLLAGSVDPQTAELAMVEAVMLAEAKDHANWVLLNDLVAVMPDGELHDQFAPTVTDVLDQEEEHFTWAARSRASMLYAKATGAADTAGGGGTTLLPPEAMSKDELAAAARDAGIAGGSRMTTSELARALAQRTGGLR